MEQSYLKTLWLKIMACFCASNQSELTQELNTTVNQPSSAEQQQNMTEQTPSKNEQRRMFSGALSTREQGQLFLGIEQADPKIIQDAIKHGADVNQSINGLDPLQYAIRNKKDSIIKYLIQSGAKIKKHHIDLAESYQLIYQSNITENDMVFAKGAPKELILRDQVREYLIIANLLKQEMAHQDKKNGTKDASENTSMNQFQKKQSKNRQNDDDDDV